MLRGEERVITERVGLFGRFSRSIMRVSKAIENRSKVFAERLRLLRLLPGQLHHTHDLAVRLNNVLERTEARIDSVDNRLFETNNGVTHLSTNLHSRLNTLESSVKQCANRIFETNNNVIHLTTSVHSRLDTFENELLPSLRDQMHELVAIQFQLRARTESKRSDWVPQPDERYAPARAEPFDRYLARAEREFAAPYHQWRDRLDSMMKAFLETKTGNAAHASDPYSRIFRSFVEIHAKGRMLDVGCGVFGRPYYLRSYPANLISGIEPLAPVESPDFEFVQGISEYLPWPDGSFSTVVSATSLDHCLSLDHSLREMTRVLRPGGSCLLWIGSNPGSPKFSPESAEFVPADQFHLFHFDVQWFEPMLENIFEIFDCLKLQKKEFSHVMYCLVKRK